MYGQKHVKCTCDAPDSCFTCAWAKVYNGFAGNYYEPPEPPEAECHCPDQNYAWLDKMSARLNYDVEEIARHCNHYSRIGCNCEDPIDYYEEQKLNNQEY